MKSLSLSVIVDELLSLLGRVTSDFMRHGTNVPYCQELHIDDLQYKALLPIAYSDRLCYSLQGRVASVLE